MTDGEKKYRVGSLVYNKRSLFILFAWMLWGDFCFTLMETVVPSIMPLKLQSLGSANWVISLIMSTVPGIFNTTICPWVSFKSDRHRGKWGRRMPFILYTMPFLTCTLILIGFSDNIGGWVHRWLLSGSPITRSMVVIFLLAIFAAMFDMFNMFVNSVYWYLFNDVVPESFLSRFMSWFRVVGVLCGALYNFFIYQYALSHMREIYIGAAILYFVGFGLMCLRVKEGQYPPPPEEGQAPSLVRDIKTFAKECYTIPYYWCIFLNYTFYCIGLTIGVFAVFQSQSIGYDLNLIGKSASVAYVLMAVYLVFMGSLVDRWNPVRTEAYLMAFNTFFAFGGLVWLFANPPAPIVLFWGGVLGSPLVILVNTALAATNLPRQMILFPKDRFGAFCGAQSLLRAAGTMVGGLLAGCFLDMIKRFYPPGDLFPYRYSPLWMGSFWILAFFFHYRAYRYWKRLGGDTDYTPPTTNIRYADLPKAKHTGVNRQILLLPILSFAGAALINCFYAYCLLRANDTRSAIVMGVFVGISFVLMIAYLRLIAFMERP